MSLEKAIERLADAAEEQNKIMAAILAGKATASGASEAKNPDETEAAPEKKKAAKKKAAPKEEPVEEADEDIHSKKFYTDKVQPKTRQAAKALGRAVVMGILDEFGTGLETAKDLEEGQWKDYVARLTAEMENAEEDDLS